MSTTVNNGYYKGHVCNGGKVQDGKNIPKEETIHGADIVRKDEAIQSDSNAVYADENCTTVNNGYFKGEVCNGGIVEQCTPAQNRENVQNISAVQENENDEKSDSSEDSDTVQECITVSNDITK